MKLRIYLLLPVLFVCLLILANTLFLPFGFSAIHEGWLAAFWLLISNSGGTVGVSLITILFCVLISMHYKGWRTKLLVTVGSLIAFSIVLGVFARLNEYFIKERLMVERPNIRYLHKNKGFDSKAFYAFDSKDERRRYIREFFEEHPECIVFDGEALHPRVVEHWIHESGYSFPSGHSFNAFLMSTLMAYIILFIYSDFRRRKFFVLPFVWAALVALSRVILGVHSALDISVGALMGSSIALLIVRTRIIDKRLVAKEW